MAKKASSSPPRCTDSGGDGGVTGRCPCRGSMGSPPNFATPSSSRFRRLEAGLLLVCAAFLGEFLWLSSLLPDDDGAANDDDPAAVSSYLVPSRHSYQHLRSTRTVSSQKWKAYAFRKNSTATRRRDDNNTYAEGDNTGAAAVKRRTRPRRGTPEWQRSHWDPGSEGLATGTRLPLKDGIHFPIFVASLPKSGTTSIWQYFQCGGHPASHQWIKRNDTSSELTGRCMYDNIVRRNRPPFEGCGHQRIHTDAGYARFVQDGDGDYPLCYFPSISALEDIYRHYPNSTIVMVVRNSSSWYDSMNAWAEGTLLTRWKACNLPHFPNVTSDDDSPPSREAATGFYEWHTDHVRKFARNHPSIRYVEVQLESNGTGSILEDSIGIPARCWGKCTPASKFCQRIVDDRQSTTA